MAGRRGRSVYATRRWSVVRLLVLQRDGYTCRSCGAWGGEVHHVRALEDGGAPFDLQNLRSLCRGCHFRAHHKKRPREQPEVRDRAGWRALIGSLVGYVVVFLFAVSA